MAITSRRLHVCFEIRHGRTAVHAMVEVHDMALAAAGEDTRAGSLSNLLQRAVSQQVLIYITLEHQTRIVSPGGGQIVPDSKADHVGARSGHQIEVGAFFDKQN